MSDKKEAYAKIAALVAEAEAKVKEAEAIADAEGVSFDWDGFEYGMGGWYTPGDGWEASAGSC